MICEFCGGNTEKHMVTKTHWLHSKLYFLEDVESEVCRECGERYFQAKVLDKIDTLLQSEHKVERHLQVEVIRV
ncbi:MAG: YgiT-type zinc finger protein [bacterium]|nr:YgiT-type zinc finger protein [bacterium]